MKVCSSCGRLFANDADYCQVDGLPLGNLSRAPAPMAERDSFVGQRLGDRYLIFRVVADGAMGRVYEGVDTQLERHVALKVLHPDVALDRVSVERFRREWEVSRQLQHRHVVDVIDFLPTEEGSHVLVMEFLTGEELRSVLIREHLLAPERVVRILSQLALALDIAHQHKLVHRDLKPENLFLCGTPRGDFAKVLDFGSVKDQRPAAKQLTIMGTTIGSPFYMSPEQVQASPSLDGRADVWALAAVAYECLTGQVPFTGDNGPTILVNILTQAPKAPSEVAAASRRLLPASVDRALLRGLSKSVAGRTASVGELAEALGHAFGLTGDHQLWANMPEAELKAIIIRKLPGLLAEELPPQSRTAAVIDGFFGEFAALGSEESGLGSEQPVPSAEAAPISPLGSEGSQNLEPRAEGAAWDVPVTRPGAGLWLALLLGIVVVASLLYGILR